MREIASELITKTVERLCVEANRCLPGDVSCALRCAEESEPFAPAKDLLTLLTRKSSSVILVKKYYVGIVKGRADRYRLIRLKLSLCRGIHESDVL